MGNSSLKSHTTRGCKFLSGRQIYIFILKIIFCHKYDLGFPPFCLFVIFLCPEGVGVGALHLFLGFLCSAGKGTLLLLYGQIFNEYINSCDRQNFPKMCLVAGSNFHKKESADKADCCRAAGASPKTPAKSLFNCLRGLWTFLVERSGGLLSCGGRTILEPWFCDVLTGNCTVCCIPVPLLTHLPLLSLSSHQP